MTTAGITAMAVFDSVSRLPEWTFFAAYAGFWILVAVLVRSVLRRSLARVAALRRDELSEVLARSLPRPAASPCSSCRSRAGVRSCLSPTNG